MRLASKVHRYCPSAKQAFYTPLTIPAAKTYNLIPIYRRVLYRPKIAINVNP